MDIDNTMTCILSFALDGRTAYITIQLVCKHWKKLITAYVGDQTKSLIALPPVDYFRQYIRMLLYCGVDYIRYKGTDPPQPLSDITIIRFHNVRSLVCVQRWDRSEESVPLHYLFNKYPINVKCPLSFPEYLTISDPVSWPCDVRAAYLQESDPFVKSMKTIANACKIYVINKEK